MHGNEDVFDLTFFNHLVPCSIFIEKVLLLTTSKVEIGKLSTFKVLSIQSFLQIVVLFRVRQAHALFQTAYNNFNTISRTNPKDVIDKLENNHRSMKKANLNNIAIKEDVMLELIEALRHNSTMEELSIANTTLSDYAAANLACALQNNIRLERLNLESNNVSPNTLVKIFEVGVCWPFFVKKYFVRFITCEVWSMFQDLRHFYVKKVVSWKQKIIKQ